MHIPPKLNILSRIYDLYDAFSAHFTFACVRGCSTCCTQNVTITSLEGYRIVQHLVSTEKIDFLQQLEPIAAQKRFQPSLTTNQLASLCLQQEEPPEESIAWPETPCPFLSNNECLIYSERPFGCRCFSSTRKCALTAHAEVDPFLLTANMLFMQFVEDIDHGGLYGNMTDVLLWLKSKEHRKDYEMQTGLSHPPGLCINRRIPGLLVPPEHQKKIQPLLEQLRKITGL